VHNREIMKTRMFSLFLAAIVGFGLPGQAQGSFGSSFSPNEVKNAREKGDVVSLKSIFKRLKTRHGGHQIDANLFNKDGKQVYVIDWMTGRGERVRFDVDAKSGRVLSSN